MTSKEGKCRGVTDSKTLSLLSCDNPSVKGYPECQECSVITTRVATDLVRNRNPDKKEFFKCTGQLEGTGRCGYLNEDTFTLCLGCFRALSS